MGCNGDWEGVLFNEIGGEYENDARLVALIGLFIVLVYVFHVSLICQV